jgi:hypothetical protein
MMMIMMNHVLASCPLFAFLPVPGLYFDIVFTFCLA